MVSPPTVAELSRVVAHGKFGLNPRLGSGRLGAYLPWCEFIDVPEDTLVPECRDPSDIPFLQLAAAGAADALVTADQDLLALAPVFSVPILTAGEARRRLAPTWPARRRYTPLP